MVTTARNPAMACAMRRRVRLDRESGRAYSPALTLDP
jgi:hypothetical protein